MNTYAQKIRRELHAFPEIGFELPKTLAVVRRELDAIGLAYTEEYGQGSIVATLNPRKGNFTIALRADMDALPMQEENDVPYKSQVPGKMHACGHDAHTAILLATAKELKENAAKIDCCVKFLFQPAEESGGGAKMMLENGAIDDADCVLGLHCNNGIEVGKAEIFPYAFSANSDGFLLDFYGKSIHASIQHKGADAIMMAVKAYTAIEFMIAKEINAANPCIFNVGAIHAGESNNIVANHCRMYCTLRTYDHDDREKAISRIKTIIDAVALESGGRAEYTVKKEYPAVYNDPGMTRLVIRSAEKILGAENLTTDNRRTMAGEDFSFFAQRKPGCFFRLGTGNQAKGIQASLHQVNFDIDEEALDVGVKLFTQFVYDNMGGIKF
ncbi:MAG: amidohydrolase [Oscillospiraceae bacterium]|nr:amidohydrolase [Oscillospiraceae bacterium]